MSRRLAELYCSTNHDDETVIISISSPNMIYSAAPYISDTNNVKDILELCFYDADGAGYDVYGRPVTDDDLMTADEAKSIVDFVKKHDDKHIIVHCDAGISRSSGVAAAILRAYTDDDSQIFDNLKYAPNMYAYHKVLAAFGYDYTHGAFIEGISED